MQIVDAFSSVPSRCNVPGHCTGRTRPILLALPSDATSPPTLPRRLYRLAAVLGASETARTQSLRLLRIGEALPAPSLLELGDQTRVRGCVSVVHVTARAGEDGRLRLAGAADSKLARGLVALLVRGLQGEPVDALLQLDVRELAAKAGLTLALTPSRLNGLDGMVQTMRKQLLAQLPSALRAVTAAVMPLHAGLDEDRRLPSLPRGGTSVLPPATTATAHPQLLWPAAEEEVAVLLSGGVDSSVALHQLLAAGHRCRAFYLRIWLEDEQAHAARGDCPWEEDWAYCEAVCEQAGVPLEAVSLQKEYQEHVVGYLVAEAAAGRTPNPDIMCNSRIKFGVFHDRVGRHFGHVASGHYARTAPTRSTGSRATVPFSSAGGKPMVELLRSADAHKDQTYFLSQLRQEQLSSAIFPIGGMSKPEVRAAAHALHLPNRARKDSQGICFLGQLNYDDFLRDHLGEAPGHIIEFETGEIVGTHRGLWYHTVGQRRGLGPVLNNAFRAFGPWHVVHKDFEANVLYATRSYTGADKARNAFRTAGINWVAGHPPTVLPGVPLHLQVKVRHGAQSHEATVALHADGYGAEVELAERDKGLAPGQFAAFYDGEVCLGSGVIVEGAV